MLLFFFLSLHVSGFSLEEFQEYPDLSETACPSPVEDAGDDSTNWPTVHDMDTFLRCNHVPRLFTMGLNITVETPYFRTVTSRGDRRLSVRADGDGPGRSTKPMAKIDIKVQGGRVGGQDESLAAEAESSISEMAAYLEQHAATQVYGQEPTILFAQLENAAIGFFGGSHVDLSSIVHTVVYSFVELINTEGVGRTLLFQYCGGEFSRRRTVGIVVDTSGGADSISSVHSAVNSWSAGQCVSGLDSEFDAGTHAVWMIPLKVPNEPTLNTTDTLPAESHSQGDGHASKLRPRAECKTVKVESGDNCDKLASKCGVPRDDFLDVHPSSDFCPGLMAGEIVCCNEGTLPQPKPNADGTCVDTKVEQGDYCYALASECEISLDQLLEFNNGGDNFCDGLMPGSWLCCTPGELPSHAPKPNPDGSCATHILTDTDLCYELANTYDISVDELISFNEGKTWGWKGCNFLYPGTPICLGPGDPPLPEAANAICGPQKPGTVMPTDGTKLADLNPCPLNACCNGWGWCGISEEYCTAPEDGNPLTAAKSNQCISNCGMDIVNNDTPPSEFINVAYFESWNAERPCLWMDVDDIDTGRYTHVHYAFAELTPDLAVNVSVSQDQFNRFVGMSDIKRVVSFGGWTDSTDEERYGLIRKGVSHPGAFARTLVKFVTEYDLDGLDIDWEYPEAPDVSGTDDDGPTDGEMYLEFLDILRQLLPSDKSLSIAAPASHWFLRGFPQIEQMAEYLDYVVFMTYDLHGQWDWGSNSTQSGCPDGNCLRSHVNMTETLDTLSMITKAGVPSNKVIVGVPSYGRSFRMEEEGCTGPECTYVGRESGAKEGVCTGVAGYLANAEIERIIAEDDDVQVLRDEESESDIVVYDKLEWVAYLNETTKDSRRQRYQELNFGGTADWAVDLQAFSAGELEES